jgi:hypothetical protein
VWVMVAIPGVLYAVTALPVLQSILVISLLLQVSYKRCLFHLVVVQELI